SRIASPIPGVVSERVLTLDHAKEIFARRRDAWLREDVDAYLACFAVDMTFQAPSHREPLRGRDAFADLVRRSYASMRPISFDFDHLAVEGDFVLAEWRIAAETRQAPARRIAWAGMSVCRIRGDEIVSWREYWDPADLR